MVIQTQEDIVDVKPNWQPEWLIDVGHNCKCGITIDDHCYVVLCKDWLGQWKPSSHIPLKVAMFLGEITKDQKPI